MSSKNIQEIQEGRLMDIVHPRYGKVGIMAIDRTICGRCCGGVRFSMNEIPTDEIKGLAENMTLKLGFLKVDPRGGCKIGISVPSEVRYDRKELFLGVGNSLKDVLRNDALAVGVDLGTYEEDVRLIYQGAGIKKYSTPNGGSSYYTAKGIFVAMDVARTILGLEDTLLNIAIEGLGKVGIEIIKLSLENNCRVVAFSNKYHGLYNQNGFNIDKIVKEHSGFGDEFILRNKNGDRISKEKLSTISGLDVLIPCATAHTLKAEMAHNIKAKTIIPASNLAADEDAKIILFNKNTLCVPDFIANSGGILGSFLANLSLCKSNINDIFYSNFKESIRNYLVGAHNSRMEPFSYSKSLALKNFFEMKNRYENSLRGSILKSRFFNCLKRKRIARILVRSYLLRKLKYKNISCI